MTDTSKRIDSDGNTLFQIGYESLLPNDGKLYGLQKSSKGKNAAKLVEITDTTDLSDYVKKEDLTDYAKTSDLPAAGTLMTGEASEVADLDNAADLAAVITKVNALLAELRDRGVVATPGE